MEEETERTVPEVFDVRAFTISLVRVKIFTRNVVWLVEDSRYTEDESNVSERRGARGLEREDRGRGRKRGRDGF